MLVKHGKREYVKVPTQPPLDGLPFWAQIAISILIGVGTLGAAFKGYFIKGDKPATNGGTTATIAGATLMDNLSIRQLSDQLAHLSGDVVSLERAMTDNTHWVRSKFEQDREICQRLREAREAAERLAEHLAEARFKG